MPIWMHEAQHWLEVVEQLAPQIFDRRVSPYLLSVVLEIEIAAPTTDAPSFLAGSVIRLAAIQAVNDHHVVKARCNLRGSPLTCRCSLLK